MPRLRFEIQDSGYFNEYSADRMLCDKASTGSNPTAPIARSAPCVGGPICLTVMEEYQSVLSSCQLTFETLNDTLVSLGLGGGSDLSESSFRTKMKYLWNEPQTQILRTSISSQQSAITLLLSVFQAYADFSFQKSTD
jgi:hypothetical protein